MISPFICSFSIRYLRIANEKRVSVLAGKRMAGGTAFVSGNLLEPRGGFTVAGSVVSVVKNATE